MSFFRYPGGKSKIKKVILEQLNLYSGFSGIEYREPFFGGGSIGTALLSSSPLVSNAWINDKDRGIADVWSSVINNHQELMAMIMDFNPSIEAFDQFKSELKNNTIIDPIENGFKKIAIHQMSYSGLGTMSGGPLGGRKQESQYKIDCRWSPRNICKKIDKAHKLLSSKSIFQNKCTNIDFYELIKKPGYAFIYLDPPYYEKGNQLYQYGFSEVDHIRLSNALRQSNHPWILSYDDCDYVRELYQWANIFEFSANYSITSTKDKKTGERRSTRKVELLICSNHHVNIRNAT